MPSATNVRGTKGQRVVAGPHGSVGVRVTTGTLRNCARVGGRVLRDEAGKFIAKDGLAADLVDCSDAELGSPSGAFLDQGAAFE